MKRISSNTNEKSMAEFFHNPEIRSMQRSIIVFFLTVCILTSANSIVEEKDNKNDQNTIIPLFPHFNDQRSSSNATEEQGNNIAPTTKTDGPLVSCFIEIREVKKVFGHCIHLPGRFAACVADKWITVFNEDCRKNGF